MCPRPYLWSCCHCQESKSMAHSVAMELPWASTFALPFSLSISLPKVPCSFITLWSSPKALLGWFCVLFSVKFSSPVGWVWEVLAESKGLLSQRIGKRDNDLQNEWLKSRQSHALIVKTSVAIFYTCLYCKNISISFLFGESTKKISFYLIYKVTLQEREEKWSCHNYNGIEAWSICKHSHGACNMFFPGITDIEHQHGIFGIDKMKVLVSLWP